MTVPETTPTGSAKKRVVIAADGSLVGEAIHMGLRNSTAFRVLGQVDARRTSVRTILDARPDVVLVDDMQHSQTALALIRHLKADAPALDVILLTLRMDEEWLADAFAAGADGAISKSIHPVALATLLRETLHGNVVHLFSRGRAGRDAEDPAPAVPEDCPLTARELEILQRASAGATNGEIARELWVTEQTVKFHLSRIYRKLEVANRTEATHYAFAHGLIAPARPTTAAQAC